MSNLRVLRDLEDPSGEPSQLSQPSALEEIETMPVVSSRPSSSRRRPRDEEPDEPRRRRRIPSTRSVVIVLEVEPAYGDRPEAIFEGRFTNEDTEVQAWSMVEGVGHYRWLQGPMRLLTRERQLEFIAETMRHLFDFLRL